MIPQLGIVKVRHRTSYPVHFYPGIIPGVLPGYNSRSAPAVTRGGACANQLAVKLLPFRRGYRLATALGLIIAACHSGETRDPLPVGQDLGDNSVDSGSDASLVSAASGNGGTSGTGGNSSQHPDAGSGGVDASYPTAGTSGIDAGDADIEDYDAEAGSDVEAGSSCGDGNTDLALDEECDDGNDQHSDGCEIDCKKTTVTQVALGRTFACVLSSAGGVKCWGTDIDGSLGRGTLGVDITHPSQIEPLDFGTSRRVTQISTSYYHACVRFDDGKARCWGDNATGQLGIDSTNDYGDEVAEQLSALPDLPLDNVQSISAGIFNTCAIIGSLGQERMYCWGGNLRGELGVGNKLQQETPGQMVGLGGAKPKAATITWRSVCGLLSTGAVRCWGDDSYGVRGVGVTTTWLGDNELPDSDSYNVLGLPGPVTMHSGETNTVCAISGGDVYCWGRNADARAGYAFATYGDSIWQTPGKVNLGDVSLVQVSAATTHTCALDDEGFVRCWGSDDDGALGYPGVTAVGFDREPVLDYELMGVSSDGGMGDAGPVTPGLPLGAVDLGDFDGTPGPDAAIRVEVMGGYSCAIMESGGLRCWGESSAGLVGYPEVDYIGVTDSPAQAYQRIGYSDVNVFGPAPTP